LASTNPALAIFALLFAVGALLFAAGSWMLRRQTRSAPGAAQADAAITWTRTFVPDSLPDAEQRISMIEQLALLGEPWCAGTLEHALREERDADVRSAAENALLLLRARRN
jgi:hypothetical protein